MRNGFTYHKLRLLMFTPHIIGNESPFKQMKNPQKIDISRLFLSCF
ncbi:hypothetical protein THOG05_380028 [Vibrio rotiferianus]|nr:hypothetical protein THOG05_380028 [Vibrio rotiferianus]